MRFAITPILFLLLIGSTHLTPQKPAQAASSAEEVIINTDIGNDIDDAFAVAVALKSPELGILGTSTCFS